METIHEYIDEYRKNLRTYKSCFVGDPERTCSEPRSSLESGEIKHIKNDF